MKDGPSEIGSLLFVFIKPHQRDNLPKLFWYFFIFYIGDYVSVVQGIVFSFNWKQAEGDENLTKLN